MTYTFHYWSFRRFSDLPTWFTFDNINVCLTKNYLVERTYQLCELGKVPITERCTNKSEQGITRRERRSRYHCLVQKAINVSKLGSLKCQLYVNTSIYTRERLPILSSLVSYINSTCPAPWLITLTIFTEVQWISWDNWCLFNKFIIQSNSILQVHYIKRVHSIKILYMNRLTN